MKRWQKIAAAVVITLGASSAPVVSVPEGYYVRQDPASQAQFALVTRAADVSKLKEARIIGKACYDQFVDPEHKLKPIRQRIDCKLYWDRAQIKNYPNPVDLNAKELAGGTRVWGSYETFLFDTPSGDMEKGYYAKAQDMTTMAPAGLLLEAVASRAQAAITLDAVADQTVDSTNVTSLSYSHTVGGAADMTFVVGIGMADSTAADRTVTAASYNSDALTFVREDDDVTSNTSTAIYYRVAPDTGANTVSITLNGSNSVADAGSLSVSDTDGTPIEANSTSGSTGSYAASVVTVTANAWVFAVVTINGASNTYTIAGSDVQIGYFDSAGGDVATGYFGPQASPGATTVDWTCGGAGCSGEFWRSSQVAIKPKAVVPEVRSPNANAVIWYTED